MGRFLLYDCRTGRGLAVFTGPEILAEQQGRPFVPCGPSVTDASHYVSDGAVREKSRLQFELQVNGFDCVIEGLPAGVTVGIEGSETVSGLGAMRIAFDVPGIYRLTLRAGAAFFDEELEVEIIGHADS